MARVPEEELERIKHEVAVERLIEASGIALKRAGKDLLGCCPFHDDREASLVVTPSKNLWHCFACQVGGGPIDWVMKKDGVSFRHAVELLREGVPTASAMTGGEWPVASVKRWRPRVLAAPLAFDADEQRLLKQVIDYYHATLKQSPEAIAYLQQRGLTHPEVIDAFKLGYANRTLGLRLPDKQRKEGAAIRSRLQKLGLYRASGHEHFNGSLVIPIFDVSGNVTEVYGRKIRDDLRPGTPLHLYLPGPHRGVFNLPALQASKEIILCEALIDALTFWGAGYRNVTASYGVEGFTDDHLAAFEQYGTERVLIAYDRDEAGEKASEKLAEKLIAAGIECYRIQFPKGMDANEYALKVTPAAQSLGLVIRKALWLGSAHAPPREEKHFTEEAAPPLEPVRIMPEALAREETSPSLAAKRETVATLALEPTPITSTSAAVLPATPLPALPASEIPYAVKENEVLFTFADRRYRVRGLAKNLSYEVLKVNLLTTHGEAMHVDTLDLYSAKQRAHYLMQAAAELKLSEEIIKHDLGKVLLQLEALQAAQIEKTLAPKPPLALTLSESEREAALALLRDPKLIERIPIDFAACGLIGEKVNKLVGYLAATSRKLAKPLGVIIQSSSAAGKSSLMEAILSFMPEEERVKYSAMTGQSLFYMNGIDLKHKILAVVEEEGASRAAYALKLLHSEGELTIASTGKNPATGDLETKTYQVKGPVAPFLTTTASEVDPELQNRCLLFAIDESREQTQAIHRLQRAQRSLDGLFAKAQREDLLTLHQNAQRLLRPLEVLNPYAQQLTFPNEATRTRRDHEKYLTLIDTLALLHQYQREIKTETRSGKTIEYVIVTLDDIALANALAHEVLGRSLDELPPQTRRLLLLLDAFVTERAQTQALPRSELRFSRRVIREHLGWGDTQLKLHLARLTELEYLLVQREKNGSFSYELLYDGAGKEGQPFVPGLIDVAKLQQGYDRERSGLKGTRSGIGRPLAGEQSATGRNPVSVGAPHPASDNEESLGATLKTQSSCGNGEDRSYAEEAVIPPATNNRQPATVVLAARAKSE